MAVDWIKMRVDLQTHPKIVRIMSALRADKFRVIGGLHAVWSVFDAHTEDGRLDGYTAESMDAVIGWPGFSAAMELVGWLEQDGETLVAPGFEDHNGRTAKRRAMETERKRSDRKVSASHADEKRTRVEKSREEVNNLSVGSVGEHPPPAESPPLENATRKGELCKRLRTLGIDAAPHLQAWAELLPGYSDVEIIAAAEAARDKKPGERLHLNYLIPILKDRAQPRSRDHDRNADRAAIVGAFTGQSKRAEPAPIDGTAVRVG